MRKPAELADPDRISVPEESVPVIYHDALTDQYRHAVVPAWCADALEEMADTVRALRAELAEARQSWWRRAMQHLWRETWGTW